MNRLACAAFVSLMAVAGLIAYQVGQPRTLVTEAEESTGAQETIAAGVAALALALTPTVTPYLTSTPTRTPKPATQTPQPTYGPSAEPGWYIVPAFTEVPPVPLTVEPDDAPPCETVTPRAYADQPCQVSQ